MKRYESKYATCPFYKHENPNVIFCKGHVPDSVIHLAFANKSTAFAYKNEYCRHDYKFCEIYRLLLDCEEIDNGINH